MKKTISICLACVLCMVLAAPAFAYNYDFSSGEDTLPSFGKATSTDEPVSPDPMIQNERRNKDAAFLPPPYFYGSGDIPTDPSSLYHEQRDAAPMLPRGGDEGWADGGNSSSVPPPVSGLEASTSTVTQNTEPLYYADGSIGTLYVVRTGKTIKVYEGEQLSNLKKGAGHFAMTSIWDGNVGMCGHNRGSWPYFAFVKDLKTGDKITYTTRYGTRTYVVFSKEQISEYDYSKLGWSADNILTLITCIADTPELRWAAQCKEVK